MPNRFEKYTRAGTPGRATLSADTVRHQAIRQPRPAAYSDMGGQGQVRGPSLPKNVRRGHRFRDAMRTDGSGCLRHAIPRHGAVGLRFVSQGCWSRRPQSDPFGQTGATRFAHPPSDDAGQPGLASSPCFHTRQFNKIGLPAQIPIGCRPAVCPRRQTGRSGLMLPGGPVAVSTKECRGTAPMAILSCDTLRLPDHRGRSNQRAASRNCPACHVLSSSVPCSG